VADKEHFYAKLYDGGVRGQPPAHLSSLRDSVKGMRLGIFWDHFQHSDPEVVRNCVQVVEFLKDQGAEIVNITIPHLRELHMSHAIKIMSEFGRTWDSKFYNPAIKLEANTEITVVMGKALSAVELLAGEKIRTLGLDLVRRQIFRDQKIDAIISPSLGLKVPKPMKGFRSTGESNTALVYKVMRFIPLANLLGLPGLSIPIGYEKDTGLPIGFQIMGDAWMEHKLLQIATAVESQFLKRRKPSMNYVDPLSEWLH
jgi:aspartyl-tRNA(Asn)/glutamyl-tRNA(Gln) amidotransferase subunit A